MASRRTSATGGSSVVHQADGEEHAQKTHGKDKEDDDAQEYTAVCSAAFFMLAFNMGALMNIRPLVIDDAIKQAGSKQVGMSLLTFASTLSLAPLFLSLACVCGCEQGVCKCARSCVCSAVRAHGCAIRTHAVTTRPRLLSGSCSASFETFTWASAVQQGYKWRAELKACLKGAHTTLTNQTSALCASTARLNRALRHCLALPGPWGLSPSSSYAQRWDGCQTRTGVSLSSLATSQ
jgi:hypothetical protein